MVNYNIIFEQMKQEYEKALLLYYPTVNARGFCERNLTSNFISAYKKISKAAVSWLEVPIVTEQRKGFIDGIIIDNENDTLILIESKRLFAGRKVESAKHDIARLKDVEVIENIKSRCNTQINHIERILLADIWTDNKDKIRRFERWQEKNLFEPIDGKYFFKSFEDSAQLQEYANCVVLNYKLLCFMF
jgi:hypothetical protein